MKNKKTWTLLAGISLILIAGTLLAVFLPPFLSEQANEKAKKEAEEAFSLTGGLDYPDALFASGNKTVALQNGTVLGVFDSADDAAKALLDNPETSRDESVGYTTKAVGENEALSCLIPALPSAPDKDTVGAKFTFDDAVEATRGFDAAPVTYEAWIRVPTEGICGGIIIGNYGGGVFPCFCLEIFDGGVPRIYVSYAENNSSTATFSNVNVRTGEWLHLAVVNDVEANEARCYVDGELKETRAAIREIEKSVPAKIGGDNRQDNKKAFKGEIHSVAVYDSVRTVFEIQDDMKTCGTDGLLAAWNLSYVPKSRVIADASANGFNLSWPQIWFKEKEPVTDYDYSFAIIGDTQLANVFDGEAFLGLFDWIVENREEKKIAYTIGLGDITDVNRPDEWDRAVQGYGKLDAADMPYTALRGNHDRHDLFDQTFDKDAYTSHLYGSYGGTLANTYRKINVQGNLYLIITLDFGARDDVLEWASEIIEKNPDYNVIIATHAYLYPDGTTIDKDDSYAPTNTDPKNNNGDDIWEKLVRRHENISLVLCGHECDPYIVCTQTKGDHGNTVTQIMSDHSYVDSGQHYAGFDTAAIMTMLYFSEDGTKVDVECYSTNYDMYYRAENQFSFTLDTVDKK